MCACAPVPWVEYAQQLMLAQSHRQYFQRQLKKLNTNTDYNCTMHILFETIS